MILYKYFGPVLKKVLSNKEIRFTQPEFFNDPFESFPFIYQVITENRFDNIIKSKLLTDEFIKKNIEVVLNENYPLLSSSEVSKIKNSPELINHLKPEIGFAMSFIKKTFTETSNTEWINLSKKIKELADEKIGIFCLSETKNNLIMWAHYTNCHKGFLIGFDSTNSFFHQRISQTDEFRFLRPVTYAKKRTPLTL